MASLIVRLILLLSIFRQHHFTDSLQYCTSAPVSSSYPVNVFMDTPVLPTGCTTTHAPHNTRDSSFVLSVVNTPKGQVSLRVIRKLPSRFTFVLASARPLLWKLDEGGFSTLYQHKFILSQGSNLLCSNTCPPYNFDNPPDLPPHGKALLDWATNKLTNLRAFVEFSTASDITFDVESAMAGIACPQTGNFPIPGLSAVNSIQHRVTGCLGNTASTTAKEVHVIQLGTPGLSQGRANVIVEVIAVKRMSLPHKLLLILQCRKPVTWTLIGRGFDDSIDVAVSEADDIDLKSHSMTMRRIHLDEARWLTREEPASVTRCETGNHVKLELWEPEPVISSNSTVVQHDEGTDVRWQKTPTSTAQNGIFKTKRCQVGCKLLPPPSGRAPTSAIQPSTLVHQAFSTIPTLSSATTVDRDLPSTSNYNHNLQLQTTNFTKLGLPSPPRARDVFFRMEVFRTDLFRLPYDKVLSAKPGQRIYIQITMTTTDSRLSFLLESCQLSLSSDPKASPRRGFPRVSSSTPIVTPSHFLIESLCPNGSLGLEFYQIPSPLNPSPGEQQINHRFSFRAQPVAAFPGRPSKFRSRLPVSKGHQTGLGQGFARSPFAASSAVVFLHCKLAVCSKGTPIGALPKCMDRDEVCRKEGGNLHTIMSPITNTLTRPIHMQPEDAFTDQNKTSSCSRSWTHKPPPPPRKEAPQSPSVVLWVAMILSFSSFLLGAALVAAIWCIYRHTDPRSLARSPRNLANDGQSDWSELGRFQFKQVVGVALSPFPGETEDVRLQKEDVGMFCSKLLTTERHGEPEREENGTLLIKPITTMHSSHG
uniref:transforming growth factor beta receptor type 3 n=1 Tax=Myxine glutinosa TaxID=7769 RepID=UPI00358F8DD5